MSCVCPQIGPSGEYTRALPASDWSVVRKYLMRRSRYLTRVRRRGRILAGRVRRGFCPACDDSVEVFGHACIPLPRREGDGEAWVGFIYMRRGALLAPMAMEG
eukprot:1188648-Prorocentrum_minimum.AAC.5